MVNGRWCVMVNGGWVELGFHEERPHQVTPISLPAKQVSRENHYWGLDSLKDPLQECVEHTLRKDQKITKNTKNICLKDKKEKKQINNAGFW